MVVDEALVPLAVVELAIVVVAVPGKHWLSGYHWYWMVVTAVMCWPLTIRTGIYTSISRDACSRTGPRLSTGCSAALV